MERIWHKKRIWTLAIILLFAILLSSGCGGRQIRNDNMGETTEISTEEETMENTTNMGFHTAAASNRKKSPKLPDSSRPCRLMKRQGRLLLGRLLEKLFYEAYRILFARCKSFKLVDPGSGHKIGGQEISFCGSRSDDEVC